MPVFCWLHLAQQGWWGGGRSMTMGDFLCGFMMPKGIRAPGTQSCPFPKVLVTIRWAAW